MPSYTLQAQKTYLCEVCGESFRHAAVLRRHHSLHVKEEVALKRALRDEKPHSATHQQSSPDVFEKMGRNSSRMCTMLRTDTKSKLDNLLQQNDALNLSSSFSIQADAIRHRHDQEDQGILAQNTSNVSGVHFINVHPKVCIESFSATPDTKSTAQNTEEVQVENFPTVLEIPAGRGHLRRGRTCTKNSHNSSVCVENLQEVHIKKFPSTLAVCSQSASRPESKKGRTLTKISRGSAKGAGKQEGRRNVRITNSPTVSKIKSQTRRRTQSKKGGTASKKSSALHVCNICHKEFGSRSKLERHETRHDPSKPFGCEVCGKFFDDARFVKTHRTLHEKKSRKECDICGKAFNERIFFDIHRLTHFEQKPFRCDVCEDIFKDKTAFLRHRNNHKARTKKVAERFLSMREVLKQKLGDGERQS